MSPKGQGRMLAKAAEAVGTRNDGSLTGQVGASSSASQGASIVANPRTVERKPAPVHLTLPPTQPRPPTPPPEYEESPIHITAGGHNRNDDTEAGAQYEHLLPKEFADDHIPKATSFWRRRKGIIILVVIVNVIILGAVLGGVLGSVSARRAAASSGSGNGEGSFTQEQGGNGSQTHVSTSSVGSTSSVSTSTSTTTSTSTSTTTSTSTSSSSILPPSTRSASSSFPISFPAITGPTGSPVQNSPSESPVQNGPPETPVQNGPPVQGIVQGVSGAEPGQVGKGFSN